MKQGKELYVLENLPSVHRLYQQKVDRYLVYRNGLSEELREVLVNDIVLVSKVTSPQELISKTRLTSFSYMTFCIL